MKGSKRRGTLSVDKNAVERRKWFETLERQVFNPETEAFDPRFDFEHKSPGQTLNGNQALSSLSQALSLFPPIPGLKSPSDSRPNSTIASPRLLEDFKSPQNFEFTKTLNFEPPLLGRIVMKMNDVPNPRTYVFCFPGVGLSHVYFKRWGVWFERLQIQLYSICLKGRMHRLFEDPSEDTCEGIATDVYKVIRDLRIIDMVTALEDLTPPSIILFGHSVGAYLAFEVSRLLVANGQTLRSSVQVFVSSAVNPTWLTEVNIRRLEREAVKYVDPLDERTNGPELERLSALPRDELIELLQRAGLVPRQLEDQKRMVDLFLPVVRHDYALLERYFLLEPDVDSLDVDAEQSGDPNVVKVPKSVKISVPLVSLYSKDDETIRISEVQAWEKCSSVGCQAVDPVEQGSQNYLMLDKNKEPLVEFFERLGGEV